MKDTRERIIQQATLYFSENDYEGASLNEIAGALGITKGGIYHYFKSKDELFKAVVIFTMDQIHDQFIAMAERQEGSSIKETLSVWFLTEDFSLETEGLESIDFTSQYGNTIYLIFTALKKFPELQERLGNIYISLINKLTGMFIEAQTMGEIRKDIDPEALAFEVCAFGEGSMLLANFIGDNPLGRMGSRTFTNFWNRIKI